LRSANAIAVASDGTNGPLLAYRTSAGAFYAKQGGRGAQWVEELSSGATAIAMAI